MSTYDPLRKVFQIPTDDMGFVGRHLLYAMREIRTVAGLPLDKYERTGLLQPADHAQRALIEVAERLGLDLGARWGNEIDLRGIE
jgi:hypothetical protein